MPHKLGRPERRPRDRHLWRGLLPVVFGLKPDDGPAGLLALLNFDLDCLGPFALGLRNTDRQDPVFAFGTNPVRIGVVG
jgi:hypothetical protein